MKINTCSALLCALLFAVVFGASPLAAQSWITEVIHGTPDQDDRAYNIVNTEANEALSIGLTYSYADPANGPYPHIVLSDPLLGPIIDHIYDVQVAEYEMSIYECENGDRVWTTAVIGFSLGAGRDILVARTDPSGGLIWARVLAGEDDWVDMSASVIETSTGDIVVAGHGEYPGLGFGSMDAVVFNLDGGSGAVNWSYMYGTPNYDAARCIREIEGGNFIVVGESDVEIGGTLSRQAWAYGLDPAGFLTWSQHYGSDKTFDRFNTVVVHENGVAYATGVYDENSTFGGDVYVAALDPFTGALFAANAYATGAPGDAIGWFITNNNYDDNLVVVGEAGEVNFSGFTDGFFMLLDQFLGIPLDYRQYGWEDQYDGVRAVAATNYVPALTDPGYYMAGWGPFTGTDDHWLLRSNMVGKTGCDYVRSPDPYETPDYDWHEVDQNFYAEGFEVWFDYAEVLDWEQICDGQYVGWYQPKQGSESETVATDAPGLNISPNPVAGGGSARLDFEAAEAGTLSITICDLQGRELMRAVHEVHAGQNSFVLPTQKLTAGLYNVRLQQGDRLETASFVLVD